MITEDIAKQILSIIKPSDKVLDIGGGRYPWWRADYIIDKRTFEEKVGETAWQGSSEKKERFSKETWVSHDFYDFPWPFPDNYFDFSLCMGTLEDLRDPISIAKEIERVSKAGYISTPTRAWESSIISDTHVLAQGLVGYIHHRWFVECIDKELIFRTKSPIFYTNQDLIIEHPLHQTLHYFWHKHLRIREEYYGDTTTYLNDAVLFKEKHQKYLSNETYQDSCPYYYIDDVYNSQIECPNEYLRPTLKPKSIEKKPKKSLLKRIYARLR